VKRALPAVGLLAVCYSATFWAGSLADDWINDLYVYRGVADPLLHGHLPYRDVFFEYPPLAAPAISLPGLVGTGEDVFRAAFAGWMFLLAVAMLLLCGALAASTGGSSRRAMFAVAVAPLLTGAMIRTHFDLAPVVLLLAALLLLLHDRTTAGYAVLGLAVMTKVFPLVAAPVALAWTAARRGRSELLAGVAALLLVCAVISAGAVALSPSGAADAGRYQIDRPVQVESSPAVVLRVLDAVGLGEATRVHNHRSDGLEHSASGAVAGMFAGAGVALVILLALRAGEARDPRALVAGSLGAVAVFASTGKVLSPQYLIWTLPLGALAVAWGVWALAAVTAAATLLTLVEFPSRYGDVLQGTTGTVVLVGARNVLLLCVVGLALRVMRARASETRRSGPLRARPAAGPARSS
jgi:Glycosyltransferase family 87